MFGQINNQRTMTLDDANKKLEQISEGMKSIPFVSYAAVVKNMNQIGNDDYFIEYGTITDQPDNYILGTSNSIYLKRWKRTKNTNPKLYQYAKNSSIGDNEDKFWINLPWINSLPLESVIPEKIDYNMQNSSGIELLDDYNYIAEVHEKIKSGISIGNKLIDNKGGTLGAIFSIKDDTNNYAITNYHVISNGIIKGENSITHPALSHSQNRNLKDVRHIGIIKKNILTENLDLGIIKLEINKEDILPGNSESTLNRILGVSFPKLHSDVSKYGLKTGSSKGKIISTNASVSGLFKVNGKREFRVLKNQIMTQNMYSDSGDSGSIVIDSNKNAIGLLFARDSNAKRQFLNPINLIFDTEKGSSINGTPPYKLNQFLT